MTSDSLYVAITAWATVALVIATIFMIWWQITESKKVARLQLAVQLSDRFESPQMRATREALAQLLLSKSAISSRDFEPLIDLFESVADLDSRRWLDRPTIESAFSLPVQYWWEALSPAVNASRQSYHDTTVYEGFEALAKKYGHADRVAKQMPSISASDLEAFLKTESK